MIDVLVIDDHALVGLGTKALIEQEHIHVDVIFDSTDVEKKINKKKYNVYLVDLYMPKINGLELTEKILKIHPDASILIYTGFDIEPYFNLLIEKGVVGIISKISSRDQVINAIYCANKKEAVIPYYLFKQLRIQEVNENIGMKSSQFENILLNQREKDILSLVEKGTTNKNIALSLNLSQRSIEYTLTEIFSKLRVSSRVEAVNKAKELKIIPKINI